VRQSLQTFFSEVFKNAEFILPFAKHDYVSFMTYNYSTMPMCKHTDHAVWCKNENLSILTNPVILVQNIILVVHTKEY